MKQPPLPYTSMSMTLLEKMAPVLLYVMSLDPTEVNCSFISRKEYFPLQFKMRDVLFKIQVIADIYLNSPLRETLVNHNNSQTHKSKRFSKDENITVGLTGLDVSQYITNYCRQQFSLSTVSFLFQHNTKYNFPSNIILNLWNVKLRRVFPSEAIFASLQQKTSLSGVSLLLSHFPARSGFFNYF